MAVYAKSTAPMSGQFPPTPPHSRQATEEGEGKAMWENDGYRSFTTSVDHLPLPPSPLSQDTDYGSPLPPTEPSSPILALDGQAGESHLPKIDEYIVLSSCSFGQGRQGAAGLKRYRSVSTEASFADAVSPSHGSRSSIFVKDDSSPRKIARATSGEMDGFALDELDSSSFAEVAETLAPPQDKMSAALRSGFDWQEVIARAVEESINDIELDGRGLTDIPAEIGELKFVISKPHTALGVEVETILPIDSGRNEDGLGRRAIRTRTNSQELYTAFNAPSLKLFLQKNRLNSLSLPQELFDLDRLVLLTLRNNKLTELPSSVGRLHSLQELNLAFNRLKYLPAEILQCKKLSTVFVEPNPLLSRPSTVQVVPGERTFAPLVVREKVPTLVEYASRKLLLMAGRQHGVNPMTATDIRLPVRSSSGLTLSQADLPEHLYRQVTVAIHQQNYCCNPECRTKDQSLLQTGRLNAGASGRFAQHAVERVEWTTIGVGEGAKEVPILWRGCSLHCLDFLDEKAEADVTVIDE